MEQMYESNNMVLLRGELVELPQFSHENHGRQIDRLSLEIQRLSGNRETVPVMAEHSLLAGLDPSAGDMIEVTGQLRSYNNRSGEGRRLVISVLAGQVQITQGQPDNQVELQGRICREPVYRRTPLGREICDVMLAVERRYGRMDYLPCILWGSLARMAAACAKGTELWLQGRLQSRTYYKQTDQGGEERTAYEVSVTTAQALPD